MKKLMHILLFLFFAANLAAQEKYVIELVCDGAARYYRIDGGKGYTYEWFVKDTLGNLISKPDYTSFMVVNSPGDTIWGSEVAIIWDIPGVFDLSTLIFSEHGCDTVEQGQVNIYPSPGAVAGDNIFVCINQPVVLSGDTAWSYSNLTWTTSGDGTFENNKVLHPTFYPGANDNLNRRVILVLTADGLVANSSCVPAIDSMEIFISNPEVVLASANLLCYNDSSGWIKPTVSGGIEPYSYAWIGPGTYSSMADSIFGLAAGKYFLTVTDSIGCIVADSVEITEPLELLAQIVADTTSICDDGIISLTGIANGGTGQYNHLWTGNGAVYLSATDGTTPFFEGALAGVYTLLYNVTDENGCVAADSIKITVLPKDTITVDTVICGFDVPFAWYGKELYVSGVYTDTLQSLIACDTIAILNLTVLPIDTLKTDTVICATEIPFIANGNIYFTSGFYTDTIVSSTGCDSIFVLNLTVIPKDTIRLDTVICGLDAPFAWYGRDYFNTSIYIDTLPSPIGCDTILILDLTVLPIDTITNSRAVCANQLPFTWYGKDYYYTNVYTDTLLSVTGCDTIAILDLTVIPIDTITFDVTICGLEAPYEWYGNDYFFSGTYTDTLAPLASGCDTILVLNLTVLPIDTLTVDTIICITDTPLAINGKNYFETGVFTDTLIAVSGCDSILILNLTVTPIDTITIDTTICGNEVPLAMFGKEYFSSGIFTDTLPALVGCDTVVILNLNVIPIETITIDTVICGLDVPLVWKGFEFFNSGIFNETFTPPVGCDTILALTLTVLPVDTLVIDTTLCANELPFAWNGKNYYDASIYTDTISPATGCDSIFVLYLKVLPVDTLTIDTVVCGLDIPFAWNGKDYYTSGIYPDTLVASTGCDSLLILNLTILPVDTLKIDTVICETEIPFVANGIDYLVSGIYTDTIVSATGCDSILVLSLMIIPKDTIRLDTVICGLDAPLAWHGVNYFNTGVYTGSLASPYGCDTTLILNLTVIPVDTLVIDTTICASEIPFLWNGKHYYDANIYTDTISPVTGCDSILVLDLKIIPEFRDTISVVICENELPFTFNGEIFTAADTVDFIIPSITGGCDTIRTFQLQTLPSVVITEQLTICENKLPYLWYGQEFTTSGTIVLNIPSVTTGCDTIRMLQLEVLPLVNDTLQLTVCESELPYTWHGEVFNMPGTIVQQIVSANEGCDTIRVLRLDVWPFVSDTLQLTVCENEIPYTWFGHTFNAADTIVVSVPSSITGCDTIRTLWFETVPAISVTEHLMICENELPFTWYGHTFTAADTVVIGVPSGTAGCDTIRTLAVQTAPVTSSITEVTIFASELPFVWNGNYYNAEGMYNLTMKNVYGCDSLLTLILHVIFSTGLTDTVVCVQDLPVVWNGQEYFTEGLHTDTIYSVFGTDSIVQLNITIIPEIKPVFDQLGPYCQYSIPDDLPTVSDNGITGYWTQSAINTSEYGIQLLTFIPDPGQCAVTENMEIEVYEQRVVSVTIVADKTEVGEGEPVTFTANAVNGGNSPEYAWFVNGSRVAGQTLKNFTYIPKDGDIVYAELISDYPCTTGNSAISNMIAIKVTGTVPVSVTITGETDICEGDNVTFTATPVNGGSNPVYAWFVNGNEIPGATSVTYTYTPHNGDFVYTMLTSSLTDVTGNPATSNIISVRVTNELTVSVSMNADKTEICDGERVTFTAKPVNGGLNPVFAWYVNGVEVPGETSATFTYTPKNSDLVHVALTSDLSCAKNNPAISNKVPIKVIDNATVSVTIVATEIDICETEPVTFTATPANGGNNPVYAWYVNKVLVPGETGATYTYTPKHLDKVYAVLTSDLVCTTGAQAYSNTITIYVGESFPVSVSIVADKDEVCDGELVTFTATPVNGGTKPVYAWFVNGLGVKGVSGPVLTYAVHKGDEVYTRLTSNADCALGNPANSNKINVIVNDKQPVDVSIVADKTEICDGEQVTFTATPVNGGNNPVYEWFVNGKPVTGETGDTFTYQPGDGDEVVVKLTSDDDCVTSATSLSNIITIKFTDGRLAAVDIAATPGAICVGEEVTFTATPVNGGNNPVYAWFVNGIEIAGETGSTMVYRPLAGDMFYVRLTSDEICLKDSVAYSDSIAISVDSGLPVSVSIAEDKNNICIGEVVTFAATPVNGGANPAYQWFVNGNPVAGETASVFGYSPADGDEVYVVLTSDLECVTNNPATSNKIVIIVNDKLPVGITIVSNKTEICEDELVNFKATPVNGGKNPVYTWFINGVTVNGVNSVNFAYRPKDGDEIFATLESDLACVTGNPATSNKITISVVDMFPIEVSIVSDKTSICEGETVTFAAIPVNGGTNPEYEWYVNNVKIIGATTDTFKFQPRDGDIIHVMLNSDPGCGYGNPATSNKIAISVKEIIDFDLTIKADIDLVCEEGPVTFTSRISNKIDNPLFAWFVNGKQVAGETSGQFTYIPKHKDKVFATVETDMECMAGKTDTSNVIVVNVGDTIPPVAICRNITVYLDAGGKASIVTAQIDNGSYDNCKLDTLYLSRYDFGCADVGKNPVTLTAVDAVGLTGECVATVTVLDTIKPVVICRGPFEIQLDENAGYKMTVAEILNKATDACGIDTMYVFPHQLDCDNIGLTTVTLMVVGVNNDSAYCQTDVMVYGNRPPFVVNDSAHTFENIPVVIDIIENDFDEKTTIDISSLAISIKPLHGKVSVNPVNGDLTYTPNRNFSGIDVLQYSICDDGIPCKPECGTAYVFITVEPVNEKPLAVDDYYSAGCFSVTRNVLDNDSDPDGTDNLYINTTPVIAPVHGQLIIDPNGTISYFPNEGYIGIDSFQYVICDDGIPSLCDSAWVYIDVDCSEESQDPLDCELFIPEGFSPNGDGIHDFFRIMCIHNYPNAKLMIFNRNGELLWQKEHYGNYDVWGDQYNAWWWGTSVLNRFDVGRQTINGEPRLKVGNYIYVLQLGNGDTRNGTVMISY